MYSKYSFEELSEMMEKEGENSSQELIYATLSKGIEVLELYIYSLMKKYNFNFDNNVVYEIVNSVVDNITKYYSAKRGNFKAYMFVTAKGKLLNYFRDNVKGVKEFSYNAPSSEGTEILEFFESQDESSDIEAHIMVKEAFSKLDEKCQKSLYYSKVMNYSVAEIKEKLELVMMSVDALRKQISNCLKKLREVFGN